MDELKQLQDKLSVLKQIPNPALRFVIAMFNLEQMIKAREDKLKK